MTPEPQQDGISAGEQGGSLFDKYIDLGIKHAISTVGQNFENSPVLKNNLPFHNTDHTRGVMARTEAILTAIQQADPSLVDRRAIQLGKFAAGFHDVVQNWEENPVTDGEFTKIMRKRFTGQNETDSVAAAITFMRNANTKAGTTVFSLEDERIVREAIMATVPGFDPAKGTIIQPNLTDQSSIVSRALALADIGNAGMEGAEKYLPEGDALFREENLDIFDGFANPANITHQQKEYFKSRMIKWSTGQIGFAVGRKALLESEVAALPEFVRRSVMALFSKFDKAIAAQTKLVRQREQMNFDELASSMGFI